MTQSNRRHWNIVSGVILLVLIVHVYIPLQSSVGRELSTAVTIVSCVCLIVAMMLEAIKDY